MGSFVAAHGVPVTYGHGLVDGLGGRLGQTVVVTQPEIWEFMGDQLGGSPSQMVMADDLSPAVLDHLASSIPEGADSILGVGGGTAMDVAKWIGWRTSVPLHLVPTLPSVNACFTRMTALRDGGRVRYEGDAVPTMVHVDLSVLQAAPRAFVSAGIGDVLSCHTALADWRYAVARGHTPEWQDEGAGASLRYIDGLAAAAPGLKAGTDDGITSLMELHREIGWRCHELQHARFEEGSEHFFAYCFEDVTGRTILHGELVSMGVLIMSSLTGQQPEKARSIVADAGTRHRPEELGITWDEIDRTLLALPAFSRDGGYWFSYAQTLEVTDETFATARAALDF
jgi:glycerol dehydrogenase-like iron-containing ADH family enzyme